MPWLCVKRDGSKAYLGRGRNAREVKGMIPDYIYRAKGNYSCVKVTLGEVKAALGGIPREYYESGLAEVPPHLLTEILQAHT